MRKSDSLFLFEREAGWLVPVLFEQLIEVLDPAPHSAALNMALDEALLQHAALPYPAPLRLGASQPAVSLGYFPSCFAGGAARGGRSRYVEPLDGRRAGGTRQRCDLHAHRAAKRVRLFSTPAAGILSADPRAHRAVVGRARDRRPRGQVPSASEEKSGARASPGQVRHDIVAGASKLAGAAQRRTRWGLLHQGSVQIRDARSWRRATSPTPSPCAFSKPRSARSSFNPQTKSHSKSTRRKTGCGNSR